MVNLRREFTFKFLFTNFFWEKCSPFQQFNHLGKSWDFSSIGKFGFNYLVALYYSLIRNIVLMTV